MDIEGNSSQYKLLAFHLTGRKSDDSMRDIGNRNMVPALMSRYRDLSALRHDYPLVLTDTRNGGQAFKSLSSIVNGILRDLAPKGFKGEGMRRDLLGLETEIRWLAASERPSPLSKLWQKASKRLIGGTGKEVQSEVKRNLGRAKAALVDEGTVVRCDEKAPTVLLAHAWRAQQSERNRNLLREIAQLKTKLAGILSADDAHSDRGLSPDFLRDSMGSGFDEELDFDVMSNILTKTSSMDLLPENRRRRIQAVIAVLESQRLIRPEGDREGHSYQTKSCSKAIKLYKQRLPEMAELIKAIRIGELEIENDYDEEKHDVLFDSFTQDALAKRELELFPSYLVCSDSDSFNDLDKAKLIEVLSSQLPINVLYRIGDVFSESSLGNGSTPFGGWNTRLANIAVNLHNAFVLQTSSSYLYQLSGSIKVGMAFQGPALFCVYSGKQSNSANSYPYLASAAAMQSRVLPTLVYDPRGGDDWASCFSLNGNPVVDARWPIDKFDYQDKDLNLLHGEFAFTFADFLACDKRFADQFVSVSRDDWSDSMIPVHEYLELGNGDTQGKIPFIWMVDKENLLQRVAVTRTVVDSTRRCGRLWSNLQEMGGVNSSFTRDAVAREKERWLEEKNREIEEIRKELQPDSVNEVPKTVDLETVASADRESTGSEEETSSDEAYIEVSRCTTCNECTLINDKMFAYNENQQAYIADITAGTFRELVTAAEKCKVAIIHPGKPINPDEDGIEELIERAEAFQ